MIKGLLFSFCLLLAVSATAQDTTNRGTEFWVGYGHHQAMEVGINSQAMTLYISTDAQPAIVTVTIDSSGATPADPTTWWKRTFTIPAYTVIDLETSGGPIPSSGAYDARLYSPSPSVGGTGSVGLFRKKGIRIESNVPVVVYSHIYSAASSGASMLVPVQAWGGNYTSANTNQQYDQNSFSWMYIIAKYNNTVIEITPSVKTKGQDRTGLQPGVTSTITLMKGQIYQLMGANLTSDAHGNGGTSNSGYELTGTRVRSVTSATGYVHPIGVFSGSSRTYNPATCGMSGGDNDMQQHFPRQAWGTTYLTAPMSQSTAANAFVTNIYKVVVTDPATVVRRNGVVLTGLVNNSYYTYESNTADVIQADQPVLVVQLMGGGPCNVAAAGDPEIIYLSPINQGTTNTIFFRTTKENITVNYLTLIIPTAGVASLTIDGSSTFDHSYPHPQMPGYTVVVKKWAAAKAQAIVQSSSVFTGITYGLGSVESYGYNIGTKINAIGLRDASVVPAGFTGDVALPLALLDFSGMKWNNDVLLKWKTVNQQGVDRFEVERSPDGAVFKKITTVLAAQSVNATYQATDVNGVQASSSPILFYRLKMIDKDGKYNYSRLTTIRLHTQTLLTVQVAPNPVRGNLQVQLQAEKAGAVVLNLRDMSGKLVASHSMFAAQGSSSIEMPLPGNMQKGIYILEVKTDGTRQYVKVLK